MAATIGGIGSEQRGPPDQGIDHRDPRLDGELGHALLLLCCLRVIRPSLAAFRVNSFVRYHELFEVAQNDPDLERFLALVDGHEASAHFKRCARFEVAAALTTQGIAFADLSAEALLHYATATREGGWGGGDDDTSVTSPGK